MANIFYLKFIMKAKLFYWNVMDLLMKLKNTLLKVLKKKSNALQMENCKCVDLGIPSHLHQAKREPDNIFEVSEDVYRRFPLFDNNNKPTILEDNKLSASVFSTKRMSLNRSKYCEQHADVLYNVMDNSHFNKYGIASISVEHIEQFIKPHPTF